MFKPGDKIWRKRTTSPFEWSRINYVPLHLADEVFVCRHSGGSTHVSVWGGWLLRTQDMELYKTNHVVLESDNV